MRLTFDLHELNKKNILLNSAFREQLSKCKEASTHNSRSIILIAIKTDVK